MSTSPRVSQLAAVVSAALFLVPAAAARDSGTPLPPSQTAARLDGQVNWGQARLIVVQDAGRYKTLESFARERISAMYGQAALPGLSPLASFFEMLFNKEAYLDTPLLRVKEEGLRIHFTEHMSDEARRRVRETGLLTPRELMDLKLRQRMQELAPRFEMSRAINRVRNGEQTVRFLDEMIRIVPRPGADRQAEWFTPDELRTNAALALPEGQQLSAAELAERFGAPAPDVTPAQAARVLEFWLTAQDGWRRGDAAAFQQALDGLAQELPTLAARDVYPSVPQRVAEDRYYGWFISSSVFSKASLGWFLYLVGAMFAITAVVTRWPKPWWISLVLLLCALAWHGYAVGLRWYIIGRIPVANMFEAITAAAWAGMLLGLLIELYYRTRVILFACHVVGFAGLVVAGFVLPGGGTITSVMGILDNIMLRIHTVMIIISYAMIFLAAVIAVLYLFGYYFTQYRAASAQAGLWTAVLGAAIWLAVRTVGTEHAVAQPSGFAMASTLLWGARGAALAVLVAVFVLWYLRVGGFTMAGVLLLLTSTAIVAVGHIGFATGTGLVMLGGGIVWALLNGFGLLMARQPALVPAAAGAGAGGSGGGPRVTAPLLAGAPALDDPTGTRLPGWLQDIDFAHLIILNIAFVLLFFGGVVLGAAWADYSWGRPWGWDPKETFALNTWIIYAILIHARFVVKRKGLWTAWLSVLGCLMMIFNWCVVNFYIVGLHSYA